MAAGRPELARLIGAYAEHRTPRSIGKLPAQIGNRHEHLRNTSECEQARIVEPELRGLKLLARETLTITRMNVLGLIDDPIDVLRNDRRAKKLKGNKRK